MPKAGKYDYPFFDLDSCIEKLREYHQVIKTDETSRAIVAETLHMSMKGGGFVNLISSMEKYGLIETGKKNVTITDFGKAILAGEATEIEQNKRKAVSKIDLFRELYEQFGRDIQQEQIRLFLRQKADVDIFEATKMAKNIDTIYKKVVNYIIPTKQSQGKGFRVIGFGRREENMETEVGKEPLKIQKGGLYIEISPDNQFLDNVEYAMDYLTFMQQRLKGKTESKKDKPSEKG
jgi:hypothetical protein